MYHINVMPDDVVFNKPYNHHNTSTVCDQTHSCGWKNFFVLKWSMHINSKPWIWYGSKTGVVRSGKIRCRKSKKHRSCPYTEPIHTLPACLYIFTWQRLLRLICGPHCRINRCTLIPASKWSSILRQATRCRATGTDSWWPFKYVMRTINYWDNSRWHISLTFKAFPCLQVKPEPQKGWQQEGHGAGGEPGPKPKTTVSHFLEKEINKY